MTRKVFWDDPYLSELETTITEVGGTEVTLDSTICFAFSGGQESDHGTIGGLPVLRAATAADDIRYTLPADHGLRPGDPVTVEIDWPRRHRLMRLHFAAELILELVYRRFPGTQKTGAHIGAAKARIDFGMAGSIAPHLPDLLAAAAAIIAADRPITSAFSDPARGRRYWQIADFAQVPCGGTHLKSTGEVGGLELRRRNPGKNQERIEITLTA